MPNPDFVECRRCGALGAGHHPCIDGTAVTPTHVKQQVHTVVIKVTETFQYDVVVDDGTFASAKEAAWQKFQTDPQRRPEPDRDIRVNWVCSEWLDDLNERTQAAVRAANR